MASTRLTNVVVPELFSEYNSQDFLNKNVFLRSGIAFSDPQVEKLMDASQGGSLITLPYWNTLSSTEPNIGNDDPSTKSTPEGHSAGFELATKTFVNKSFSTMDLAGILAGDDPMADIQKKIDGFWMNDLNTRIVSAAKGICADSVANHDGDLVYDITGNTGTGEDSPLATHDAIITASGKIGDRQDEFKVIAMHSVVYNSLRRQKAISSNPMVIDNGVEGFVGTKFGYLDGMMVLVDDTLPVETIGDGKGYYTFMFADNVFSVNSGYPGIAEEVTREAASGNGMGEELLYTRRCWLVHPRGYKVVESEIATGGLSYAKLAAAATWARVWGDRKRIKFVALKTLG